MEARHDEEESRPFLGKKKKKTKEVISLPLSLHASNFQKKKKASFLDLPCYYGKKKGALLEHHSWLAISCGIFGFARIDESSCY